MTKFIKKADIRSNWYEIDAKDAVVGRLATIISKIIRGKNKTTPNKFCWAQAINKQHSGQHVNGGGGIFVPQVFLFESYSMLFRFCFCMF